MDDRGCNSSGSHRVVAQESAACDAPLFPREQSRPAAPEAKAAPLLNVLSEDDDLLVLNKPAGLVCHPTKGDAYSSLISRVRLYLGDGWNPHLVNRLDRETSGIVVVAKHLQAAVRLRRLWENRDVRKEYLAIVRGRVVDDHRLIDAPIGKDDQSLVAIKGCVRSDGAPAATEFFVVRRVSRDGDQFSLLRVLPHTGRKHQIRIHLAHVGHAVLGDKIYGGDETLYLAFVAGLLTGTQQERLRLPHHALHAAQVEFSWRGCEVIFRAEAERWFEEFLHPHEIPNVGDESGVL